MVLIQIYTDLLLRRKITRQILSDKYELSIRTISRYIDTLAKAGIPIEARTGHEGGYYLPKDYKIEHHSFSEKDWQRISLALKKTAAEFGDDLNLELIKKLEG